MSGQMMHYPPMWQEFADNFTFEDRQEVYTNGSTLIPLFRVNQMMEHYHDPVADENAKLRELLVGMAERVTNPVGGCLAPGCAYGCPHFLECDEELHTCWYVDRLRELGIEV